MGILVCISIGFLHKICVRENGDDRLEIQAPKAVVAEERCIVCRSVAEDDCHELRCRCVVHADCLLEWWDQAATSRPSKEVQSRILRVECPSCKKMVSISNLDNLDSNGITMIREKMETVDV